MISVLIPTQDRPLDLLACLHGLAKQNAPSLLSRVIVVDDNSRTPYPEIIEQFAAEYRLPLHYIASSGQAGAAHARNLGAAHAEGEILAFLDDDAVPEPDWLQVIARELPQLDAVAITGRILPLDEQHLLSRARQLWYSLRERLALADSGQVSFLAGGNAAIWRADFEEMGGFDTTLTMMHDRDLVLRMAARGKRCFYVHSLVIHHRHYKGFGVAVEQTYRSGYYRLVLEQKHPQVRRWSVAEQIQSFVPLLHAARTDPDETLPALAAGAMGLVHSSGYVWSLFRNYLGRFYLREGDALSDTLRRRPGHIAK